MCNTNSLINGIVYTNGKKTMNISDIPWNKHSKFEGVYIKNLLTASESNNNLSAMIVKIDPECEIGIHIHEESAELHEIIEGKGEAIVGNNTIDYYSGVVSFIPANIPHKIKANEKGIILLAKFTPPLN